MAQQDIAKTGAAAGSGKAVAGIAPGGKPQSGKTPAGKSQAPQHGNDMLKLGAVAALGLIVIAMCVFFLLPRDEFVPGSAVDAETWKGIFEKSQNVYIVMDVRNARDQNTTNNILQCGVDFAASSPMGAKNVLPMSFGNEGCIMPQNRTDVKSCLSRLKDGLAIYVKQGDPGATYHSDSLVVTMGPAYQVGTCSISRG